MKKIFKNKTTFLFTLILSGLLLFSGSSVAIDLFSDGDKDIIWRTGLNKYIKYAPQDSTEFGQNSHPVSLDKEQIAYALKALRYGDESFLSFSEEIKPVFTNRQIKILSESLASGLSKAKTDQDIIFVLERAESKIFGLKEKTYSAGRFFFKDGELNLIVGDYEFFRSEAFEKTYDPGGQSAVPYTFDFGKRERPSKAFEDATFTVSGVKVNQVAGERRSDWLLIDVEKTAEAYITGEDEKNNPVTAADKRLDEEAAKLAKQRRELRVELARIRKEVQHATTKSSVGKSIEERMATLDTLLNKKLISQQEYDVKRKEILNDI